MPFKSEAQMKWMFANKPKMAEEWASDTPSNTKLPRRVAKKNKKNKKTKQLKVGHHQ